MDAEAVVSRGGRPDLASAKALATRDRADPADGGRLDDVVIDLNQQAYARCVARKNW